ncbi:MAG: hypothetical protein ACOYXY_11135 [Thermodesulfobacteriota bacterium]
MVFTEQVDGSLAVIDNLGQQGDLVQMYVTRGGNRMGPVNLSYGDVEQVPDFSELEFWVQNVPTDFRIQNMSRRGIDFIVLDEQKRDRVVAQIMPPGGFLVVRSAVGYHYRVIPAHPYRG